MIGLGMAVTVLVGQYLGKNRPDMAEKCAFSGFHIAFFYMAVFASMYMFLPAVFLAPYASQAGGDSFEQIRSITMILLRFVAVYSLFDSLTIIFASAIKGAGDTRFVMVMILVLSLIVLVIPSYVALEIFNADIYAGWTIASAYIIILGFIFLIRFLGGKWKSMRVIEKAPPPMPPALPESPVIDFES